MSDVEPLGAADSGSAPDEGALSVREAINSLNAKRDAAESAGKAEKANEIRDPASGRFSRPQDPAPQAENAAPEVSAQAQEQSTTVEAADNQPPIDPPTSWTKEQQERFKALPRDTQQFISERERARETDLNLRQREAAEARRAADQQRQQYEQSVANNLLALQSTISAEFSDVKSMDDVRKMAEEDPFRFNRFQAFQMQWQQLHQEDTANRQRARQKQNEDFKVWSQEQDAEFLKYAPEYADPAKRDKAREEAKVYLTEVMGVKAEELGPLWNGDIQVSFRNATVQRIVRDAAKFYAAQQAAKAARPVAPPPVQRPGTAAPPGANHDATIRSLEAKLGRATSDTQGVRAAAALLAARRAAKR